MTTSPVDPLRLCVVRAQGKSHRPAFQLVRAAKTEEWPASPAILFLIRTNKTLRHLQFLSLSTNYQFDLPFPNCHGLPNIFDTSPLLAISGQLQTERVLSRLWGNAAHQTSLAIISNPTLRYGRGPLIPKEAEWAVLLLQLSSEAFFEFILVVPLASGLTIHSYQDHTAQSAVCRSKLHLELTTLYHNHLSLSVFYRPLESVFVTANTSV